MLYVRVCLFGLFVLGCGSVSALSVDGAAGTTGAAGAGGRGGVGGSAGHAAGSSGSAGTTGAAGAAGTTGAAGAALGGRGGAGGSDVCVPTATTGCADGGMCIRPTSQPYCSTCRLPSGAAECYVLEGNTSYPACCTVSGMPTCAPVRCQS